MCARIMKLPRDHNSHPLPRTAKHIQGRLDWLLTKLLGGGDQQGHLAGEIIHISLYTGQLYIYVRVCACVCVLLTKSALLALRKAAGLA